MSDHPNNRRLPGPPLRSEQGGNMGDSADEDSAMDVQQLETYSLPTDTDAYAPITRACTR